MKKYTVGTTFAVQPLSKRPPSGKTLVQVDCTLPLCDNGAGAAAARALGWKFKDIPFNLAQGPAAFNAALEQALQDKPNYIVTTGTFPAAVSSTQLAQATKAGVAIGWIAGVDSNPAIKVCANCAPYLASSGKVVEDLVVADLGTGAKAVAVGDPTLLGTAAFNSGIDSEAKRLGAEVPSTLTVSSQASPAANAAAVVNYLQRNPDVKAVLCDFPNELVGLPAALARVGLTSKVKYINSGPTSADYGFLRAGTLAASVAIENGAAWWRAIDGMARLSVGDPATLYPSDWFQILTKANLNQVLAAGGGASEPPQYKSVYEKAWKVG